MNPSSATYSQNPNPNPNFFFQSPPQNPNPNFATPSPPPPPPVLDLSTTLSSLETLIALSRQTLSSFSQTLALNPQFLPPKAQNGNHVPCPFNPHHLMPPESLFLHSLHCPSPLDLTSVVSSINYPNTLKSSSELKHETRFIQSLQDPKSTELCFSLDDYVDFGSNFFCKGCPGVVNFSNVDSAKKTFTLPGFLSVECANFVGFDETEVKSFEGFKVLPSDLWAIRSEIDGWGDYPRRYSFNVVCTILGSRMVGGGDLREWVITNSHRYGVLIDAYMRDHILVLFKLCIKAIVREAFGLVVNVGDVKGNELEVNLKSKSFKCPVLVQVLMWLTSQFSVLYGEVNGKFFTINMLKQFILESTSRLLLFPLEEKMIETPTNCSKRLDTDRIDIGDVKLEEALERSAVCELDKRVKESADGSLIFVSQVAAAVAALHERSLLEEKIRGLRITQPLTRYQRMAEHDFLLKRADEERKKRPNYRPIIEHDGLPRQRSSNQDTNKTKTREELLAEERDYKRRRMSYRGKKVKRTTLQVMRDIIEEYMEEIKQAGGIGCFEKGGEEGGMLLSKPASAHDFTVNIDELRKINDDTSEAARGSPDHCRKELHYDYNTRSTTFDDALPKAYEQPRRFHHRHNDYLSDARRSSDRDKRSMEYYSGSLKRQRSHGRSYEQSGHEMGRDDAESTRTKHHNVKRLSSIRDHKSSYSVSNSSNDRYRRNTPENHSSNCRVQNEFEDRYDPSESNDVHEDDVFTGGKYVTP